MVAELPPRIPLGRFPTPFEPLDRLSTAWGGPRIWVKRDDLAGFGLSGNKVRKLEFHFAAARDAGADTVITCGAVQSNHSRATALAAARLGFRSILLLRHHGAAAPQVSGNYLLDLLAGSDVQLITAEQWEIRNQLMHDRAKAEAAAGHQCWIIPEGASDVLGMWGFVLAMREIADQAAAVAGPNPPVLWHAASSGGTTAGIGWAADRLNLPFPIVACSVGDPADEMEAKVTQIWTDAAGEMGAEPPQVPITYNTEHIGGGYGVVDDRSLEIQAAATALTGLILDPTYTGKALVGLHREIVAGTYGPQDAVIFWHTGGGFAVFAHDFSRTSVAVAPDARSV